MNIEVIVIVILSIAAFFLGTVPYLVATIKGDIRPNRVTWLFWSVPLISVFSQWDSGILTWASLPVFLSGLGPFLVFLATYYNKKSYWKLEKFDYFFAFFGTLTLVLFLLTRDVILTIVFAILTDALASIPTIKKAYFEPNTELGMPFLVFLFLTIASFFTMERYDFEELAFPIYLFVIDFIFVILLREQIISFFKKIFQKKSA